MAGGPSTSIASLLSTRAALRPAGRFLSLRGGAVATYSAAAAAADDLAGKLGRLGIAHGGRVLLCAGDPLTYAVGFVSIVAAGRVVVPANPGAPDHELDKLEKLSRPVAALVDGELVTRAPDPSQDSDPHPSPGVLLCTSGTTGDPKGVFLSEAQLLHVARAVVEHHVIDEGDRCLGLLPLFHVNAEVVEVLASLVAGSEVVLVERFHKHGFWELAAASHCTWVNAAPAIIAILAADLHAHPRRLPIRFVRSASAPLAPIVKARFEHRFGIPVLESYGMSEAASMITATPLGLAPTGSVGRPVGCELRVVDDIGSGLPPFERGSIEIRGPGVIDGYAFGGAPGLFRPGGWLVTGDLGSLDDEGNLYLAGRADDVINRGGEKVHPREVEDVLLSHPDVLAAAVVGAPDPVLGERVLAYVVYSETARCARDETGTRLIDRCERHLARYKVPSEIVIVDELPVGATGKISRARLRELAGTAA